MLKDLLIVLSAVWQKQPAALAFYAMGKSMTENFLLVLSGALVGMTILYFFPEVVRFISWVIMLIFRLFRWPIHFFWRPKRPSLKKIRWYQSWSEKYLIFRQSIVNRVAKNNSPAITVFIVASIPFPGFLPISIAVTRITNLRHGYGILLLATILRTYLLIFAIYNIGRLFGH